MEVNSKSNCFLSFFLVLPPILYLVVIFSSLLHSLLFLGSFKMLHFLHIVFKLSLCLSSLLLFIQTISIILVGFLLCSLFFVPFVLSPSPDSSLPLCNRFSYATPPHPQRFGVVQYIYILKEL